MVIAALSMQMMSCNEKAETILSDLIPTHGKYGVGFTILCDKDNSRLFGHEEFRTISIHIWYPCRSETGHQMHLADYVELGEYLSLEEDGIVPFHTWGKMLKSDSLKVNKLLKMRTLGVHDADSQPGKFPVVFYASSFRSSPIENFALFEYLASHGFVIAAVSSMGATPEGMSMDSEGVRMQLMDLQVAMKAVSELDFVDTTRLASMGFSLGAAPAAIMAMSHSDFKCTASIDGAMSYTYSLLGEVLDDPEACLESAFLELLQRPYITKPLDSVFYQKHTDSDKFSIDFKDLDHYDFSTVTLLLKASRADDYVPSERSIALDGPNPTPYVERINTYRSICELLHYFFDAYINPSKKVEKDFRSFLSGFDHGR